MFHFSSDDVTKSLSSGLNCTSASSHLSRFFTRTVLTVLYFPPLGLIIKGIQLLGCLGRLICPHWNIPRHNSPVMWRDRSHKIFPKFKSLKLLFFLV